MGWPNNFARASIATSERRSLQMTDRFAKNTLRKVWPEQFAGFGGLQPELLQVVVDVFVHRLAPFLAGHRPEERVRLVARRVGSALHELGDEVDELLALDRELALV